MSDGGGDGPTVQRIGDLLREAGVLTAEQCDIVARYRDERHLRFGEAAVELGYINRDLLEQALATQFDLRTPRAKVDEEIVVVHVPQSSAAEDYRSLRSTLALRWFKHPEGARTLAIVSAQRFDGRSVVCANLAASFAQVGFRTLLVDGDMRNPRQSQLFGLDDRFGLSSYLAGRAHEAAYYSIPGLQSLRVMPGGGTPPNPQELLLRDMLSHLVEEASREFDIVLFDTPAASIGSDYQLIASAAQGALVVTNRRYTRVKDAARLVNQLHDTGVRIVGSTMTSDI